MMTRKSIKAAAAAIAFLLCFASAAQAQSVRQDWTSLYEFTRDSLWRKKTPQGKLTVMKETQMAAGIQLAEESEIPDIEFRSARHDTISFIDNSGKEILIMKAIKDDETGEMVANDILDAAVVTARFRNVAERNGKVDLQFNITVPKEMMDSKWQLRFDPDMYILEDSLRLDPVIITGAGYRKAQMKGYQQYERFLSKIVADTSIYVNISQLEIFLERNIPEVYAFKTDSTEVSDEEFYSYYGVSERQAVEHYTNRFALNRNNRRKERRDEMFRRYVKAPIVTEGIRLDTVITNFNGDFEYVYSQTINTRPQLRKVDIVLSGAVFEQEKKIYTIPRSEPLTFYISSVSAFADMSEHYIKKTVYRQAEANTSCRLDFAQGKDAIDLSLGDNYSEMLRIKQNLADLARNDTFDLDSIIVTATASPEGTWATNDRLSRRRAESVSKYLSAYIKAYSDSLERERGFMVDEEGRISREKAMKIPFISYSNPENWEALDFFVGIDTLMIDTDKEDYFSHADIKDPDAREAAFRNKTYYAYLRDEIYPKLRTVEYSFRLHRKGMIAEEVETTELDTTYMRGVQAIRDRDYEAAAILLAPYQDYNTAVAYVCLDRNVSALEILEDEPRTPQVNYMLAILYARLGDEQKAVQCYLTACEQEPTYVHRGNLDPEISALIKLYGLNREPEEDDYMFY